MRIALISDIHGNLVSLEAVLADIDQAKVDQIVCLGDMATLGPQPREVMTRIRELDIVCVKGNHDDLLLNPASSRDYMDAPWFGENVAWCAGNLAAADLSFLCSLPATREIPLGDDKTLLCFHGSPMSNLDIILATTPTTEVDEMLGDSSATLMAGGHTHIQMLRRHKESLLINVGSVGLPFYEFSSTGSPRFLPCAEYALVSCLNKTVAVELRLVSIDIEAAKQAALNSDMPDRFEWVQGWLPQ